MRGLIVGAVAGLDVLAGCAAPPGPNGADPTTSGWLTARFA